MKKVNIGNGNEKLEGYLRQDIDSSIKDLDIICDIRDLDKHIDIESCDEIRCSHCMEHFSTKEIPGLFNMIYKLIKPGGMFNIIVPNFKYHAALVLNGMDEQGVYYAYGGQINEWDFHKTAFTPDILTKRLIEAGFKNLVMARQTSITCIAQK